MNYDGLEHILAVAPTPKVSASTGNCSSIEQFVDEMALAGNWDPLDWRLEMTKRLEPWQRVLLKLKEVAGFTTDLPRGKGMGIAVVADHGSYSGACATVSVSRRGQLSIEKIALVMNSGYIINPLKLRGTDGRRGLLGTEPRTLWRLATAGRQFRERQLR